MTDFSISLPAKRRRGRPRKDCNLSTTSRTLENPILVNKNAQRVPPTHPTFDAREDNNNDNARSKTNGVDDMVGSTIYGVVEGSFDAGYLISVRIGNNEAPFRGVVFQPKRIVPLTTANDVAPQATMYQRQDIKVPLSPLPQNVAATQTLPSSKQTVLQPVSYYDNQPAAAFMMSNATTMLRTSSVPNMGGITTMSRPTPKVGSINQHSLRVGHHIDEVMMQEFQASSPSRGPDDKQSTRPNIVEFHHKGTTLDNQTMKNGGEMDHPREPKDMYYTSVDFHQHLFTGQSEPANSTRSCAPDLKFDHEKRGGPSYFVHNEMKPAAEINLGYHHALVSGNPLLLPPLEFMLEKNQPNKPQHDTNIEGGGASSPSDPYKLELATPRSTVNDDQTNHINSNCITDMDFVLSDVVQQHCETKHRL